MVHFSQNSTAHSSHLCAEIRRIQRTSIIVCTAVVVSGAWLGILLGGLFQAYRYGHFVGTTELCADPR